MAGRQKLTVKLEKYYKMARALLDYIESRWRELACVDNPRCARVTLRDIVNIIEPNVRSSFSRHYIYVMLYAMLRERGYKILDVENSGGRAILRLTLCLDSQDIST